MTRELLSYDEQYKQLIKTILNSPKTFNHRTHTTIQAVPNQVIGYNLMDDRIPLIQGRRMFPVTAFAELCWTLSGDKKLDWLQQYTKMWNDFANENNEIEAAYGFRWRKMFGRDQILEALQALKRDSTDRQIFISAWDNGKDGLGNRWTSNVPCPTSFSINIINGHINLTLFLRSSDVIVGLPYDMLMYTLLLIAFCAELRINGYPLLKLGNITAILSNAHIYEAHTDIALSLLDSNRVASSPSIPVSFLILDNDWEKLSLRKIIAEPDACMNQFKEYYNNYLQKYCKELPPILKPEIIK